MKDATDKYESSVIIFLWKYILNTVKLLFITVIEILILNSSKSNIS